jgi:hypothetical protein
VVVGSRQDNGSRLLIEQCPICEHPFSEPFNLPFEPVTAAARVLALDGGGVKGVVQLEILCSLEKKIGLSIPFAGLFDLIVGTSIGMLLTPLKSSFIDFPLQVVFAR